MPQQYKAKIATAKPSNGRNGLLKFAKTGIIIGLICLAVFILIGFALLVSSFGKSDILPVPPPDPSFEMSTLLQEYKDLNLPRPLSQSFQDDKPCPKQQPFSGGYHCFRHIQSYYTGTGLISSLSQKLRAQGWMEVSNGAPNQSEYTYLEFHKTLNGVSAILTLQKTEPYSDYPNDTLLYLKSASEID